jgi:hypothetical protein
MDKYFKVAAVRIALNATLYGKITLKRISDLAAHIRCYPHFDLQNEDYTHCRFTITELKAAFDIIKKKSKKEREILKSIGLQSIYDYPHEWTH